MHHNFHLNCHLLITYAHIYENPNRKQSPKHIYFSSKYNYHRHENSNNVKKKKKKEKKKTNHHAKLQKHVGNKSRNSNPVGCKLKIGCENDVYLFFCFLIREKTNNMFIIFESISLT